MMRRMRMNKKGAVLLEYVIGAQLFFLVLLGAMEWSLELYVRHASDRALAAALQVYADGHDEDQALAVAMSSGGPPLGRCLQPLEFRLFDSISGVDLSDAATGYEPVGDATDDTAVFARITLTCVWGRITPLAAGALGSSMTHAVTGYTKVR